MQFHSWPLKDWEFGLSFALGNKDKYISVSIFKRYYSLSIGQGR